MVFRIRLPEGATLMETSEYRPENPLKRDEVEGGRLALENDQKPWNSNGPQSEKSGASRSKSVLRMRYEAEVSVIRKRLGSLEEMRGKLGLTQRKMSQLLLVDPSAWTRWTKDGEDAPPHIYRMLQWYLALEDKYPALDPQFWLAATARVREPEQTAQLAAATLDLEAQQRSLITEISELRKEIRERERLYIRRLWLVSSLALIASVILSFILIRF